MNFELQMHEYISAVNDALLSFPLLNPCPDHPVTQVGSDFRDGTVPQPLRSAMRYSLLLPGKRIRPVLLLCSYHLVDDDWKSVLPYACALEMIHTYSLIHDDLPSMDNDAFRRGQPTNHRVFGENMAILAGDGLLNLAYETMLSAPITQKYPSRSISAMSEIAKRAGVRGMVAGQTLDVMLEGSEPSDKSVAYIHAHKTADLLTAPLAAGLTLAGGSDEALTAIREFGFSIGMAFQIQDDLLDLNSSLETLGKEAGMDAIRGKQTWPAVHGEKKATEDVQLYFSKAHQALDFFGEKASFLRALADQLSSRKY